MMAGADTDAAQIELHADIQRADRRIDHDPGDHGGLVRCGALDLETGNHGQALGGQPQETLLVRPDPLEPDPFNPLDGRGQTDRTGDMRRAGLELVRKLRVGRLLEGDLLDHVPAALVRRHRLEQTAFSVEHAHAGRPVELVSGEGVKIGIQGLDVGRPVGDPLGAVDQGQSPCGMGLVDDRLDRIDGAECVGDVVDRDQPGARGEQATVGVHVELAGIVDRDDPDARTRGLAGHLPGHDVGMMLQAGQDDLVAGLQVGPTPGGGDQIDGLGRPAREETLDGLGGVQEVRDHLARVVVHPRGIARELVDPAMDVGVVLLMIVADRLDDLERLLGARGVVQVGQRLVVHAGCEDRKLGAQGRQVQGHGGCWGRGESRGHLGSMHSDVAIDVQVLACRPAP